MVLVLYMQAVISATLSSLDPNVNGKKLLQKWNSIRGWLRLKNGHRILRLCIIWMFAFISFNRPRKCEYLVLLWFYFCIHLVWVRSWGNISTIFVQHGNDYLSRCLGIHMFRKSTPIRSRSNEYSIASSKVQ